jgi:hypothetical protein
MKIVQFVNIHILIHLNTGNVKNVITQMKKVINVINILLEHIMIDEGCWNVE